MSTETTIVPKISNTSTRFIGARQTMGAAPLIANKSFVNNCLATPELRARLNEQNIELTIDEYINTCFQSNTARLNAVAGKWCQALAANADFSYRFNNDPVISSQPMRLNDYGEFMQGGLTQVNPYVSIQPTRGISFQTMPVLSLGAGKKIIRNQGYTGSVEFVRVIDSATVNTPNIEAIPNFSDFPTYDYKTGMTIEWKEQQAIANAFGERQRQGLVFDSYVGTFAPIVAKFLFLQKYYLLNLDEIAYNGSSISTAGTVPDAVPFFNLIGNDSTPSTPGTMSTNGVPFIPVTDILPAGQPTTWIELAPFQKQIVAGAVIGNVSANSLGNYTANVLRVDLYSYIDMLFASSAAKDTTPLSWLIGENVIDAIIPVAAWAQKYPAQVTMLAEFHDPSIYYFNISFPLVQTGVEFKDDLTKFGYRFGVGGINLINSLGLTQFQMPRGISGFSFAARMLMNSPVNPDFSDEQKEQIEKIQALNSKKEFAHKKSH